MKNRYIKKFFPLAAFCDNLRLDQFEGQTAHAFFPAVDGKPLRYLENRKITLCGVNVASYREVPFGCTYVNFYFSVFYGDFAHDTNSFL